MDHATFRNTDPSLRIKITQTTRGSSVATLVFVELIFITDHFSGRVVQSVGCVHVSVCLSVPTTTFERNDL